MFFTKPTGYHLQRADGTTRMHIRYDQIAEGSLVIVYDGVHYVRTPHEDEQDFMIYREDHATHFYRSTGE